MNMLGGAVAGAGIGVFAHVLTAPKKEGPNMMIEELKVDLPIKKP
jgi:hypothetical protein